MMLETTDCGKLLGAVRCGAVRCGAVRCGAVRCGAVRWGGVGWGQQRASRLRAELWTVGPGASTLSFHSRSRAIALGASEPGKRAMCVNVS